MRTPTSWRITSRARRHAGWRARRCAISRPRDVTRSRATPTARRPTTSTRRWSISIAPARSTRRRWIPTRSWRISRRRGSGLGDYDAAKALWTRARTAAERAGDTDARRRDRAATRARRLLEHPIRRGARALRRGAGRGRARGSRPAARARTRVARAMTLQALGKPDDARTEIDAALAVAERLGDAGVLARVHRSSQLLHVFIGPTERAHADGMRAIELAESAGERGVAWSAHWAMAMVGGLSGNSGAMAHHLAESERLADELGSPVLRCWTAEIAVELHSGTGDWDAGLALAERTIPMARALRQRVLLPRLLVWAAMIHLHRGATAKAKEYLDEAWKLSSGDKSVRPRDGRALGGAGARGARGLSRGDGRLSARDRDRRRGARARRPHRVPGLGDPPAAADDDRSGALAGRHRAGAPIRDAAAEGLAAARPPTGHRVGRHVRRPHRDAAQGLRDRRAAPPEAAPRRWRRSRG